MEQKYFVIINTGEAYPIGGNVDLVKIQKILNAPQNYAVKVGRKVLAKSMIHAIAKEECSNMEEYNLGINVARNTLRTKVDDVDSTLDRLETDINKMDYILINNDMLIFKHAFQHAE
ncbi:hypothetical protein [Lysinibacillus sp. RC79]|uniref:hypothetical protein n=1 Tax=Lysinibacillus sp. RC79 TaxID=3156296 RepID=UPI0035157B95